jgi:hypothetical protein
MSCDRETQNEKLLAYLKRYRFITMRQAFTNLDINNPWARLSELRKVHRIEDRKVKTRGGAQIKQYWLVQGRKRAA